MLIIYFKRVCVLNSKQVRSILKGAFNSLINGNETNLSWRQFCLFHRRYLPFPGMRMDGLFFSFIVGTQDSRCAVNRFHFQTKLYQVMIIFFFMFYNSNLHDIRHDEIFPNMCNLKNNSLSFLSEFSQQFLLNRQQILLTFISALYTLNTIKIF